MNDQIVLTLPPERALHNVAHLVIGGLAVRINLTIESLEDLKLALDGLLPEVEGEPTISVGLGEGTLDLTVGPFDSESLHGKLDRAPDGDEVSLRRVLDTVSDHFEIVDRDGASWVAVTKNVDLDRR
jgi:hypothetical protein